MPDVFSLARFEGFLAFVRSSTPEAFSPAQLTGYVAFVLGVTAFLQKSDKRLKFFNASECLAYTVHFAMLGNYAASSSALVSSVRSFLALRFHGRVLAAAIVAVNLALGALTANVWWGWLPVASSCVATAAVFTMRGVALRLALLACTFLWLGNNVLSGSIGGTLLECLIAVANTHTIFRLLRSRKAGGPTSPG